LLAADRVNVVEGIVDDLRHGYIPNIFKERGWSAEWKYNKKGFIQKAAVGAVVTTAIVTLLVLRNRRKKSQIV
jgi:tetrahydromethanopterin S-methyltransferase subunit B